jgi:hypothetical protein
MGIWTADGLEMADENSEMFFLFPSWNNVGSWPGNGGGTIWE